MEHLADAHRMLIDSLGLEPAYGGLLMPFLLALRLPPRRQRHAGGTGCSTSHPCSSPRA